MSAWISTVGLEIHAQLATKTKLFSGAISKFGLPTNSSVNLVDAAIPGTLPILNKECVKLAVLSSSALGCQINPVSYFDRKHYFYADLPSGYQITQQRTPIAVDGCLNFRVFTPGVHKTSYGKKCRIKQIQLEQDSGKSLHDENRGISLIDLNRAGAGLMEFVFEPDLSDGEEAAALVKELILILERLGSCSCKMEEGALRVDANVSISKDPLKLGTRSEIKNIGSVRGVANAIKYEIQRQINLIEKGDMVVNETRAWDPQKKETISMRDKKEEHDYRFMPEPNLPPLRVCVDPNEKTVHDGILDLRKIVELISELPETSRVNLMNQYQFSDAYAIMLVNQPILLNYFNKIMADDCQRNAKVVWNLLNVQLMNVVNDENLQISDCLITSETIGQLADLIAKNAIDYGIAKDVIVLKIRGDNLSPSEIVEKNDWLLISDSETIDKICIKLIARNEKAVKKFKKGKQRSLQTIINDVSEITTKKINLSLVSKRLKEILASQ